MPRIAKILIAVIVAIPVLGIAAAYVNGGLIRARTSGNEASAIASLRTVVSAQMAYATTCGGAYAPTLARLAEHGMIDASLGSDPSEKMGYRVTLAGRDGVQPSAPPPPSCAGSVGAFTVTAVPVEPGRTGLRFFRVDESGDVTQATDAAFTDATPLP